MMALMQFSSLRANTAPAGLVQSADREDSRSRSERATRGSIGPTRVVNAARRVWVSVYAFAFTTGAGGLYGARERTAVPAGETRVKMVSRLACAIHAWFVTPVR